MARFLRVFGIFISVCILALLFVGCSIDSIELPFSETETEAAETAPDPNATPAPTTAPIILLPEAPGILTEANSDAIIDYSNSSDGYVMVCFNGETDKELKAQVKGSTMTYTYIIRQGEWSSFPLTEGDGDYTVAVYENVEDSKYAVVLETTISVTLTDEFSPFLRPSIYVNYADAPNSTTLAAELTAGLDASLDKVSAIYDYVVENISYNSELAATVESSYTPDLDAVLASGKGICFDYASLMTGMLRSQGVPSKLIMGYVGEVYHAWISVWTPEDGWINDVIFFDGVTWSRMDPTFASTSGSQSEYTGDGTSYIEKLIY